MHEDRISIKRHWRWRHLVEVWMMRYIPNECDEFTYLLIPCPVHRRRWETGKTHGVDWIDFIDDGWWSLPFASPGRKEKGSRHMSTVRCDSHGVPAIGQVLDVSVAAVLESCTCMVRYLPIHNSRTSPSIVRAIPLFDPRPWLSRLHSYRRHDG